MTVRRQAPPGLTFESNARCGAKTRTGKSCNSHPVRGKRRCRMHGGAPGSGAPKGNKNALKHGRFTKEAIQKRQSLRSLLLDAKKLAQEIG